MRLSLPSARGIAVESVRTIDIDEFVTRHRLLVREHRPVLEEPAVGPDFVSANPHPGFLP